MAQLAIGVTGPRGGIPWAWWATSWQLNRHNVSALRLDSTVGNPDDRIAGIIVGGGNDIDPAIYGGDVSVSPNVDPERDAYELSVLDVADRRGLPVLGICRGAQLINVHCGGTLVGDLAPYRILTSNKATLFPRKKVDLESTSLLAKWMGSASTQVNSLHHQAIDCAGQNLHVVGKDRDGIVQAIEGIDGPLRIGVQWHPEYLPQRDDQRRLFGAFVQACQQNQARSS